MNSEEVDYSNDGVAVADVAGVVEGHEWPGLIGNQKTGNEFLENGTIGVKACKRIAVVDDDITVRRTIVLMLNHIFKDVKLSTYSSANEALAAMRKCPPQIILLDIMMPGISGIECARIVKRKYPDARIVIMTGHSNPDYVREAFLAGVMGYLVKPFSVADLHQTIIGALEERLVISGSIRGQFFDLGLNPALQSSMEACRLSDQETAIMELVKNGKTNSEIAWELNISANTVKTHLKRLFRKLNVPCRAQAVEHFERLQHSKRNSASSHQQNHIIQPKLYLKLSPVRVTIPS